jgi:hypothetical protein
VTTDGQKSRQEITKAGGQEEKIYDQPRTKEEPGNNSQSPRA